MRTFVSVYYFIVFIYKRQFKFSKKLLYEEITNKYDRPGREIEVAWAGARNTTSILLHTTTNERGC